MAEVQSDISQVHKETGACMANLERLDNLKSKLQVRRTPMLVYVGVS